MQIAAAPIIGVHRWMRATPPTHMGIASLAERVAPDPVTFARRFARDRHDAGAAAAPMRVEMAERSSVERLRYSSTALPASLGGQLRRASPDGQDADDAKLRRGSLMTQARTACSHRHGFVDAIAARGAPALSRAGKSDRPGIPRNAGVGGEAG